MEEMRTWLLSKGFHEGKGLSGLLQTLDAEGIDNIQLLGACWAELKPMLKIGAAARLDAALQ